MSESLTVGEKHENEKNSSKRYVQVGFFFKNVQENKFTGKHRECIIEMTMEQQAQGLTSQLN